MPRQNSVHDSEASIRILGSHFAARCTLGPRIVVRQPPPAPERGAFSLDPLRTGPGLSAQYGVQLLNGFRMVKLLSITWPSCRSSE